jgi:hypothetical protein
MLASQITPAIQIRRSHNSEPERLSNGMGTFDGGEGRKMNHNEMEEQIK